MCCANSGLSIVHRPMSDGLSRNIGNIAGLKSLSFEDMFSVGLLFNGDDREAYRQCSYLGIVMRLGFEYEATTMSRRFRYNVLYPCLQLGLV